MYKYIQKFIGIFFVLIAIYHIIVTVLGYGILGHNSQILISISRDSIWLLFVLTVFLWQIIGYKDKVKKYLKKRKNVWVWFIILVLFSIGISFLMGQSINDMMIGIKYGFFYLLIFLTASFVGFVGIKKLTQYEITRFQYFLIGIVATGFLWQIMKMIKPELFMNIGYGKFNDFYFGAKPPLYYLTSYEGTARWQGLFAGPNNYGYFLVAFLPLILLWRNTGIQKLKNILRAPFQNLNFGLIALWLLAIILTLSRSAIVGMVFIFGLLSKNWIKKNKKNKQIFWGIIGIVIIILIGLSLLKRESTTGHIHAKLRYIGDIINHPLGYGLGTSGPAIHHEGTMLPENYFMQIMLDIGTTGFIVWTIIIFQILIVFGNIKTYFHNSKHSTDKQIAFLSRKAIYTGWIGLLIMGIFLHVFEDSMVNYLFFISFGLLSGYLSTLYKTDNIKFKDLFVKQK